MQSWKKRKTKDPPLLCTFGAVDLKKSFRSAFDSFNLNLDSRRYRYSMISLLDDLEEWELRNRFRDIRWEICLLNVAYLSLCGITLTRRMQGAIQGKSPCTHVIHIGLGSYACSLNNQLLLSKLHTIQSRDGLRSERKWLWSKSSKASV